MKTASNKLAPIFRNVQIFSPLPSSLQLKICDVVHHLLGRASAVGHGGQEEPPEIQSLLLVSLKSTHSDINISIAV